MFFFRAVPGEKARVFDYFLMALLNITPWVIAAGVGAMISTLFVGLSVEERSIGQTTIAVLAVAAIVAAIATESSVHHKRIIMIPEELVRIWYRTLRSQDYQGSRRAAYRHLRSRSGMLFDLSTKMWMSYVHLTPRTETSEYVNNMLHVEAERFMGSRS